MEVFVYFDLAVILLPILILFLGVLGSIGQLEEFVQQHMDTVMTVSIIIAIIFAIFVISITIKRVKKVFWGFTSGFFSLLSASQCIGYLYFGLTAISTKGTLASIFLFILFAIYAIINIAVYTLAHGWVLMMLENPDEGGVLAGALGPIIVFVLGWLINFFLFF